MKTKFRIAIISAFILCLSLCAFTFDKNSSVRSLTKPYITTYECTSARLGEDDFLRKYDYIKITFLDEEKLEVSFKHKKGKRHAYRCNYYYDEEKKTFRAEIGILGFKYKQETTIDDGKFTLCLPIMFKTLVMNFSS